MYPSYILALAMGAGKTVLIGAIFATEFALALEYPEGPFVHNALVFAPGKTILESLRELAAVPYDKVLPPRLHKPFAASVKLTFTRDGEKTIPVIAGSSFNVVVTNTEKIRIQKETIRKSDVGSLLPLMREDDARAEVANLRLQAIASLPHLAVFSDEAHHTYGQSLDQDLKKVRKTVDYLAARTNLICAVNTTGTPYFQRQPLKDVVAWYGLSEGIRDDILKDLAGSIQAFDFAGDASVYVAHVIEDFFREYGAVRLPNGAPAKLAVYFPQTRDLSELKPVIDQALVRAGHSPALCLVNTSDERLTKPADIDAFSRLNDPAAPHRVILLVNKGTEGWNCPSLFACALARKLKTDFTVEYKDDKGKWRRYTPDFVLRRRDGRVLIVEIKREHDEAHPIDGREGKKALALRQWEALNPDRLKYEMIFTRTDGVTTDQMKEATRFVGGG